MLHHEKSLPRPLPPELMDGARIIRETPDSTGLTVSTTPYSELRTKIWSDLSTLNYDQLNLLDTLISEARKKTDG